MAPSHFPRLLCAGLPVAFAPTLGSCGSGGGPIDAAKGLLGNNETLERLLTRGLPRFDALVPSLPAAFSRGAGIEPDSLGTPTTVRRETGLLADTLDAGGATAALADAQGLSREALTLARETELAARAFAAPLLDMLADASLFSELAGLAGTAGGDGDTETRGTVNGLTGQAPPDSPASARGGHPLFAALRSRGELAVRLPATGEGLPSALLLSARPDADALTFRPVWMNAAGEGVAPAEITVKLGADGASALSFAFAPAAAKGLSRAFPNAARACPGDVVRLEAKRDAAGATTLSVLRNGCPKDSLKARVGGFSLERDAKGRYVAAGAFKAAQDVHGAGGLRASFGALPLFAFRAALDPSEGNTLAVDAAALPTDAAARAGVASFSDFGVSKVVTDYAVSSFWASGYGTNAAVRAALCDFGASASGDLTAFCERRVTGRAAIGAFEAAASGARVARPALAFVTDADALVGALDTLVGVLSIRNTMLFDSAGAPRYVDSGAADGGAGAGAGPGTGADAGAGGDGAAARASLARSRDPFPYVAAAAAPFEPRAVGAGELADAVALTKKDLFEGAARASCEALLSDALKKAGKASAAAAAACRAGRSR